MSTELNDQLATLAREQGRLEALLDADSCWRALQQLEAREARGEPLSSVDGHGLRAHLLADLAGNRLYQARTKILEAIDILTESATLPSPNELAVSEAPAPAAKPPAVSVEAARPPAHAPAAFSDEAATATEAADALATEPPAPEPMAPPATEAPSAARAIIHDTPPIATIAAPEVKAAAPSELVAIRGIDAAIADRLAALGITSFGDIARWGTEDVQRVSAELGLGRDVSRQNWIEQAAILALRAGQVIVPAPKPWPALQVQPPAAPEIAATVEAEPALSSLVSGVAQSIAARITALEKSAEAAAPDGNHKPIIVPEAEPETLDVPEAAVEIVPRGGASSNEAAAVETASEQPTYLNGSAAWHGSTPHAAADADVLLGQDWSPIEEPAVVAAGLPVALEERIANLESDVAAATGGDFSAVTVAPVLPPSPQIAAAPPPELPDVGTAATDMLPPRPMRRGGAEADVEVVQKAALGGIPPPVPREASDFADYAAYREQAEEASIEIVREGDRPQRTRLPGKPTRATREEQASAVRRFLAALNGK